MALLVAASLAAIPASPARASLGYEPDSSNSVRAVPGGVLRGIAVDQTSQDIYVAIVTTNLATGTPGEIDRFNSNLSADGIFAKGSGYYSGVAVDPITHGFYGAQMKIDGPFGSFGTPKLDRFSSAGAMSGSFALTDAEALPPIVLDSEGHIFYPNGDAHSVQVFDSNGALLEEIKCSGCPGGAFGRPMSAALNSNDDLYVVDQSPDRVVKLTSSGGSYAYASMLQSNRGAAAVAVDQSNDEVLVGDLPNGRNYHIVAYDSSGVPFDDFGAGIFSDPEPAFASIAGYQMAINATSHRLYVGDYEKFHIFERTTISPPTAGIQAASGVGQITATLNANVNANGHATLSCNFELAMGADVGFASPTIVPCVRNPDGEGSTPLAVKTPVLSPNTAYRYRVKTGSNAGSVTSSAETFQTLPEAPPVVTAEAPSAVTETGVTIKSKVNPQGGSVSSCRFEFGTTISYGSNFPCTSLPGPVATDVAESRKITGLLPGTAYHYRLVVTSNAGTAAGDDVEVTTASPPSEPEPEPQPPQSPPEQPTNTAPTPGPPPILTKPPLRCKKGFHKRRVRGKVKCVRKRSHRKRNARR